jgi:hypothetical protein
MGQVGARFGPFGDIVNLSTTLVLGLRRMYLCDVFQVEARFGPFGDSINLGAR